MIDREAPKCPWCGTEMAMAGIIHEEAIQNHGTRDIYTKTIPCILP